MSTITWIAILSIVFISGVVKGTTGFGFALFSVPLLIHFIPIKNLVPLITLYNLFSSIQLIYQTRNTGLHKSIIILSIAGVAGVIAGSLILKFLPEKWLELFTATMLIVLSILFLSGFRFKVRRLKRGNVLAGFVSGFLGGSTSVSGPPLALFLTSIKLDTLHFRHAFAWFSTITASIAFLDYVKIGVVRVYSLKIFLVSLPILITSILLGKFISKKLPQHRFYQGAVIISLLAGILLLITSLS